MIEKMIYQSRVTEVNATTTRLIGAYQNTSLSSDTNLSAILNSLEAENSQLTLAIRRTKVESELEEKDELRDNPLRGLFHMVTGYLYHPDAQIQNSAETVYAILENYGMSMIDESYATESSLVSSLLKDLAKANVLIAIGNLSGCDALIAQLQTAQNEFEQARVAYETEKAQESTEENATEIKKKVVYHINSKLVIYLRAMVLVDESNYGDFGRTIAEIIADNNSTVKKRAKKTEPED
ncbi:DUF6261 family protein [Sunxiuqinia sp. A32]|uniref:DUF6261 family protein n=1 Tax=Sunxiuqinia sp. A32 TaxID=3461496 RepID=UPI004045BCAA